MPQNEERTLVKGRLTPIKVGMSHCLAYSQPVATKGEVWLDRKATNKARQGITPPDNVN